MNRVSFQGLEGVWHKCIGRSLDEDCALMNYTQSDSITENQ